MNGLAVIQFEYLHRIRAIPAIKDRVGALLQFLGKRTSLLLISKSPPRILEWRTRQYLNTAADKTEEAAVGNKSSPVETKHATAVGNLEITSHPFWKANPALE